MKPKRRQRVRMGEDRAVCRALENHPATLNCLMGLFLARSVTHQVKPVQQASLECLFHRPQTIHSSLGRIMARGETIRLLQEETGNLILKKAQTAKYKLKIQFKEGQRVAKGPSVLQCPPTILLALKAHPK